MNDVNDPQFIELVQQFMAITESSKEDAEFHLRGADKNLEIAINHFFSGPIARATARHHQAANGGNAASGGNGGSGLLAEASTGGKSAMSRKSSLSRKASIAAPPTEMPAGVSAAAAEEGPEATAADGNDSDGAAVAAPPAKRPPAKTTSSKAKAPAPAPKSAASIAARTRTQTARLAGKKRADDTSSASDSPSASESEDSAEDSDDVNLLTAHAPAPSNGKRSAATARRGGATKPAPPARRPPRTEISSDDTSSSSDDETLSERAQRQKVQQDCEAELRHVLLNLRTEIGAKMKVSPTGVLPKATLDYLISTLAKEAWGKPEELAEVYGARTPKFGAPILTAYRRVRAKHFRDTYEPTEDERAACGGDVEVWNTVELPTLAGLTSAPSFQEYVNAIQDAALARCAAANAGQMTVSEEQQRTAPTAPASSNGKRKTVQRTLDGKTVVPEPASKKSAAAPAAAAPEGPAASKASLIRPSGPKSLPPITREDCARAAEVKKIAGGLHCGFVPKTANEAAIRIVDNFFEFPCISAAAVRASGVLTTGSRNGFLVLSGLLALGCPQCLTVRCSNPDVTTDVTRPVALRIALATQALRIIGARTDSNRDFKPLDRTPLVTNTPCSVGDAAIHRLIVMLGNRALRSNAHFSVPSLKTLPSGAEVLTGRVVIELLPRPPVSPEAAGVLLEMAHEAFNTLLDIFDPQNPFRSQNQYPYLAFDAVEGWKAQCEEEGSTPADILKLAERTTRAAAPATKVDDRIDGVSLVLKRHQRHTVALMLDRERRGHRDELEVSVSDSERIYLNFVTGALTFQSATWNRRLLPSANVRGGILADEMGLGKTLEILALSVLNPAPVPLPATEELPDHEQVEIFDRSIPGQPRRLRAAPVVPIKATLVVLPVSLVGQWVDEIARCVPGSRTILYHGQNRENFTEDDFRQADFVLTTYETLKTTVEHTHGNAFNALMAHEPLGVRRALGDIYAAELQQYQRACRQNKGTCIEYPHNCATAPHFRALARFVGFKFHRVVLDECQKASLCSMEEIHATHWWAASGTPIDSTLAPLKVLCNILGWTTNATFPGSEFSIAESKSQGSIMSTHTFRNAITWQDERTVAAYENETLGNRNNQANTRAFTRPAPIPYYMPANWRFTGVWAWAIVAAQYIIRHSKTSSIVDEIGLPPRVIETHSVALMPEERGLYDNVERRIQADCAALARRDRLSSRVGMLLQWIDTLRRAAAHPSLVREGQQDAQAQQAAAAAAALVAADTSSDRRMSDDSKIKALEDAGVPRAIATENVRWNIHVEPVARIIEQLRKSSANISQSTFEILEKLSRVPPETEDCAVCMDSFQQPILLRCGHIYCRECVLRLLGEAARSRETPKCPSCRQNTLQSNLRQIVVATAAAEPQTAEEKEAADKTLQNVGYGSKLAYVTKLIRDIVSEDPTSKFVVFSTFPTYMRLASEALVKAGFTCCVIDGSTALQKRAQMIQNFQAGRTTVCIISSRVGNAGLTLTAANHLILLEPNTNVAVDAQAMGRIHRFGQTRPVTIHRIVAKDTCEERIQMLVESGRLDMNDQEQRAIGAAKSRTSSKVGLVQMQFIVHGHTNDAQED